MGKIELRGDVPRNAKYLGASLRKALDAAKIVQMRGRVKEVTGGLIRATASTARMGELCKLCNPESQYFVESEVVGFRESDVLLSPLGELQGISSDTWVLPMGRQHCIEVGHHLLGRVLDGFGRPLDGRPLQTQDCAVYPVDTLPPNPLARPLISRPLCLGIRAIDELLTCAEGQRIGIFAAAGVGKSSLLSMLSRNAEADVLVIALVGERGREVREFLERDLGEEAMQRAVVVCATAERPAMERRKAGFVATTIAEYFRDLGKRVVLVMDSLTRVARAQREIGLAAGEPPARRGFPPSVFSVLPVLIERAGLSGNGSITAFYTVLVEGDDMNEPVADEARSILDGHIILSRTLAESGHFPAIDVLASVSRLMHAVVDADRLQRASHVRKLMAKYDEVELLLRLGEYKNGSDAVADEAINKIAGIRGFLQQGVNESTSFTQSAALLERVLS